MIKGIKTDLGKLVSSEEFLTSNTKYPPAFLKGILPDGRFNHEPDKYSVGELIGCLRSSYFERKIGHYESINSLYRSKTGKAIHNLLFKDYEMKEVQMTYPFVHKGETLYIKGKFDGYDLVTRTLTEGKTVKDISRITEARPKDIMQLQCFSSLAEKTLQALQVDKLQIVYADLENIKTFDVPKRDQMNFMIERITILHNALKNNQPPKEELNKFCGSCSYNDKCDLPSYLISRGSLTRSEKQK